MGGSACTSLYLMLMSLVYGSLGLNKGGERNILKPGIFSCHGLLCLSCSTVCLLVMDKVLTLQ